MVSLLENVNQFEMVKYLVAKSYYFCFIFQNIFGLKNTHNNLKEVTGLKMLIMRGSKKQSLR